jgi:hypothetical protein
MYSKDEDGPLYNAFALSAACRYLLSDYMDKKSDVVDYILGEYGAELVLRRFVVEMENRTADAWRKQTPAQMLTVLRLLIYDHRCTPHLKASGIIPALSARLRKLDNASDCAWEYWSATLLVFAYVCATYYFVNTI